MCGRKGQAKLGGHLLFVIGSSHVSMLLQDSRLGVGLSRSKRGVAQNYLQPLHLYTDLTARILSIEKAWRRHLK